MRAAFLFSVLLLKPKKREDFFIPLQKNQTLIYTFELFSSKEMHFQLMISKINPGVVQKLTLVKTQLFAKEP